MRENDYACSGRPYLLYMDFVLDFSMPLIDPSTQNCSSIPGQLDCQNRPDFYPWRASEGGSPMSGTSQRRTSARPARYKSIF